MLPFTREQFFEVFRLYNEAVWPAQAALVAVAIGALALVRAGRGTRLVAAILAGLWAWMALAYHLAFFAAINPAARLFGALFLAAAAIFAIEGVVRGRLRFSWRAPNARLGLVLLAVALVAYPAAGHLLGHRYPEIPSFGLPCPTTIFTLGLLLFLEPPAPRYVFAVPLLWAAIGSLAAQGLGVYQDYALSAAGVVSAIALVRLGSGPVPRPAVAPGSGRT